MKEDKFWIIVSVFGAIIFLYGVLQSQKTESWSCVEKVTDSCHIERCVKEGRNCRYEEIEVRIGWNDDCPTAYCPISVGCVNYCLGCECYRYYYGSRLVCDEYRDVYDYGVAWCIEIKRGEWCNLTTDDNIHIPIWNITPFYIFGNINLTEKSLGDW